MSRKLAIGVIAALGPALCLAWNSNLYGEPLVRDDHRSDGQQQAPVDATAGKLWLGVALRPVDDTLRAQLQIPKDQGVIVGEVFPDGPAAKAGIQRDDILLTANDKPINEPKVLADLVSSSEGKDITIAYMRAGKKETVTVKPGDRAAPPSEPAKPLTPEDFTIRLPGGELGGGGLRFFRPPFVPELPDNVTLTIVREGKNPAKITVKRGDETWEVTADNLDKLPEDLRPVVRSALMMPMQMPFVGFSGFPGVSPDIQKRLDEMNRQMDEMRKAIEELKNQPK